MSTVCNASKVNKLFHDLFTFSLKNKIKFQDQLIIFGWEDHDCIKGLKSMLFKKSTIVFCKRFFRTKSKISKSLYSAFE